MLLQALFYQEQIPQNIMDANKHSQEVDMSCRQSIQHFLENYFKNNQKTDLVNTFVEEYVNYLLGQMENMREHLGHMPEEMLFFNLHSLLGTVIEHPKLRSESAISLFD